METYYLCRVPWGNVIGDLVVLYNERGYKIQRHHEQRLRKPNPDRNVELLAKGTKEQMQLFEKLMKEGT